MKLTAVFSRLLVTTDVALCCQRCYANAGYLFVEVTGGCWHPERKEDIIPTAGVWIETCNCNLGCMCTIGMSHLDEQGQLSHHHLQHSINHTSFSLGDMLLILFLQGQNAGTPCIATLWP